VNHHTSLTAVLPAAAVYPGLVAGCLLAIISVIGCAGAVNPGAVWARWFLGVYVVLIVILALVEFSGAGALITVTNRLTVYDNSREFKDATVRRFVNSTYYHCCIVNDTANGTANASTDYFFSPASEQPLELAALPEDHSSAPSASGDYSADNADNAHLQLLRGGDGGEGEEARALLGLSLSFAADVSDVLGGGRPNPNGKKCWVPPASHVVSDKSCASLAEFENALIGWLVRNLLPIAGTAIAVGLLQVIVAVVAVVAIRRGVLQAKLRELQETDPWMDNGQFYAPMNPDSVGRTGGLGASKYLGGGGRSGLRDNDDLGGGIFDN
jgi:hypothetical protein